MQEEQYSEDLDSDTSQSQMISQNLLSQSPSFVENMQALE